MMVRWVILFLRPMALVLAWQRSQPWTASLRVIGGLAMACHVGEFARASIDVDLVAMDEPSRDQVLKTLQSIGFRVGPTAGWWRALRVQSGVREVVDVASNLVVNP
jgi:hypothetical protein